MVLLIRKGQSPLLSKNVFFTTSKAMLAPLVRQTAINANRRARELASVHVPPFRQRQDLIRVSSLNNMALFLHRDSLLCIWPFCRTLERNIPFPLIPLTWSNPHFQAHRIFSQRQGDSLQSIAKCSNNKHSSYIVRYILSTRV